MAQRSAQDWEDVEVIVIVHDDSPQKKAIQVDGGGRNWEWVPRKLIRSRIKNKDETETLTIPAWLAFEKGFTS